MSGFEYPCQYIMTVYCMYSKVATNLIELMYSIDPLLNRDICGFPSVTPAHCTQSGNRQADTVDMYSETSELRPPMVEAKVILTLGWS